MIKDILLAAATDAQQAEADRLLKLELKKMELDPDYIPEIIDPEEVKYFKRKSKNNIDKALESRGDLSEKENLKKLASESATDEFILDLSTGLLKEFEKALKQNPKLKFKTWYRSRRQKLSHGGVTGDTLAEDYGELIDAWVRKIDVMEDESLTDYINRIKAAERKAND